MQCFLNPLQTVRLPVAGVLAMVLIVASTPGRVSAHEGHAALPSTGATVDGNQVLVSEGAQKGLGLKTAAITLKDISRSLDVRAHVELPWDGQAMVTTLAPGRVLAIEVNPGQHVRAGQELARIESLEIETLQLKMLQAAEEASLAQRLVDQRRPLAERGAISGKYLLETETELRQKRVQLAIAERKLLALGLTEDQLGAVRTSGQPISWISVRSPINGVVVHSDARVGKFVDTEQHLFHIVDRSRVLVEGEVLETDSWQVRPGQLVKATFSVHLGQTFAGSIGYVRLSIDPANRTLAVKVPMDNPNGVLRPGMSGRMEITVYHAKQAIVCPTAALIDTPDRAFVLLRRGEGKYERREITVGLRTPEQVEVLKGLFPGDQVVVRGTKLLASMFHTDKPKDANRRQIDGARMSTAAVQRNVTSLIPVSQAIVELPTSRKAFASPVIEGRVAQIHARPGAMIKAGQLLAELDSQELRDLQLEQLKTHEELRRVNETLQRVKPLAGSGRYPQNQLWEIQSRQKNLEMYLQNIERKLSMIGLSQETIDQLRRIDMTRSETVMPLAMVPVRAPIDGRVADFSVALGEIVHANDVLFEVQDLTTVTIEGYVFEKDSANVAVGQEAQIRIPAYPNLRLAGEVVRVAPSLHRSSRVLPVWIEVANPDQKLREGMLATVEIIATAENLQAANVAPLNQ